jgi:uncharacterized protein YndB with AHSA1/START domain
MHAPDTIYVSYIVAAPDQIWTALTSAEFTRQYFSGLRVESDWRVGSRVRYLRPDGAVEISGQVLRCEPPRVLSFTWRVDSHPLTAKLPDVIVTFELADLGGVVRLTLTEAHPQLPDERLLEGGRRGWPAILGNFKTLVETGRPFPAFDTTYLRQGGEEMMRVLRELNLP